MHYRPDLNGAETCSGNARRNANRLIKIFHVDEEISAKVFARLDKRAVRNNGFAVPDANAGRLRCGVQRGGVKVLPRGMDLVASFTESSRIFRCSITDRREKFSSL